MGEKLFLRKVGDAIGGVQAEDGQCHHWNQATYGHADDEPC